MNYRENIKNSETLSPLGTPFLLMLASALISWPWKTFNIPWAVGDFSPISIFILFYIAFRGFKAMSQRLPLKLMAWPPAGIAAIFLLMTRVGTVASDAVIPTLLLGYLIPFLFVTIICIALSKHGLKYPISFLSLFIMLSQGSHFPILELSEFGANGWASLGTALPAVRAVFEIWACMLLTNRLILADQPSNNRVAYLFVGVVFFHGVIAGWENPLLFNGSISLSSYLNAVLAWISFSAVQIGAVFVLCRLWNSWNAPDDVGNQGH